MYNTGNQRRQETKGLNQLAYRTNQGQSGSRGLLNRTNNGSQGAKGQSVGQGNAQQNRSFNAPMMMRHKSPNQQTQQYPPHGATTNLIQRVPNQNQQIDQKQGPSTKGRFMQPKSSSQAPQTEKQQAQAQQNQRIQYQPSLMFKPGQAKQQFEHLKQGRSEPEIVSYSTQQPSMIQHQLHAAPMNAYPVYQHPNVPQGYPQPGFQPQFASNHSYSNGRPSPEAFNLEGAAQNGAQNQHPFPRQFPYDSNKVSAHPQQAMASPEQHNRPEAKKRQSPQRVEQGRGNMPLQMKQGALHQQQRLLGPTHQMRVYETAPSGQVFYPSQQQLFEGQNTSIQGQEDDLAELDRYNMPRKSEQKSDSGDEDQIRQLQNLLAEIGADVSELKKRPAYQNLNSSEPRSSAKRQNRIYQSSKSNSMSPESHKLSKSRLSNSQEGTYLPAAGGSNDLQHRSLSPQARSNSQGAGVRKQASSQSRKNGAQFSPQRLLQIRSQAQAGASDSKQWTSPHENTQLSIQAPQIPNPTPSHTNTMSLTVSVNPDHNQERLFRLSPLSSKMQEDTDGEEQSNSQRQFNLNQSINNSQLDSSSPDNQVRQNNRQPVQLGASQSTTIISELSRVGGSAPIRTFEDDDEEVASAIPVGPAAPTDGAGISSDIDKSLAFDRDSNAHNLSQQPYSEDQPRLRASALAASTAGARADTPLASATASETAAAHKQERPSSRAFSRSSNHRGDAALTDAGGNLVEGPKRTIFKEANCQTEPIQAQVKEKIVEKAVPKVETSEQDTQTHRRDFAPIQLSPFDTYDLFFVKDLVNNLNQDNEVLVDSNQDLKYAFHFLLQKHKQLQQQLDREKAKNALFAETEKRLEVVTQERDKALEQGLFLGNKVETMSRVMRLAVDEQAHLEEQSELMMVQLEEENQMLRNLLKISDDYSSPVSQGHLNSTIAEIEKKQAELAYQSDLKQREQIKSECQAEYEVLKRELPEKIENELKGRFEDQAKELEAMYQQKLSKHEEETAILKKTLLEQSLQRLQSIQQQHGAEDGSEESNSLEGSHGLHHFSSSSTEQPLKQSEKRPETHSQQSTDQLQLSSSSLSSKNNNSVVMQQELEEFTQNVYGDLTKEEQDLISQLTAQASGSQKDSGIGSASMEQRMDLRELVRDAKHNAEAQTQLDRDFQMEVDGDEDADDYMDDFEQFGEEAKSPSDDDSSEGHKLISVVTNPKPSKLSPTPQELAKQKTENEQATAVEWDFDGGIGSSKLFETAGLIDDDDDKPSLQEAQNEQNLFSQDQDDDDYLNEPESPLQSMVAKMADDESEPEIDLFGSGGPEEDNHNEDDGAAKEREEMMRQKFDEFFTSESDEIEDDLIDGESSDSDSEAGGVDPIKFEELVEAQNRSAENNTKAELKDQAANADISDTFQSQQNQPDTLSPQQTLPLEKSEGSAESNSSERRNKYKRDKRNSDGVPSSKTEPSPQGEEESQAAYKASPKSSAFGEQKNNADIMEDMLEFNPPEPSSSNIITQDFDDDDFFMGGGEPIAGSSITQQSNMNCGFFGDWGDDDDDDLFGGGLSSANNGKSNEIDEEDRRFFEELSKDFTAKDELLSGQPQQERNELMDDTRATRQMLAAQRQENEQVEDLGAIDFDAAREEGKEDEYDYFLDNQAEENGGNAQGYHVIDEADLQESEEDLEELTDEEKQERHREMLKEFKEKMEREDSRAARSPRHKPRY